MAKRPYWLPYVFAAGAALCWILAFAASLPRSKNLNKSDLANMFSIALKDNSSDVEFRVAGFGLCAKTNATTFCTPSRYRTHEEIQSSLTNGTNITLPIDLLHKSMDLQDLVYFPIAIVSVPAIVALITAFFCWLSMHMQITKALHRSSDLTESSKFRNIKIAFIASSFLACLLGAVDAYTLMLTTRATDILVPEHVQPGVASQLLYWVSFGSTVVFSVLGLLFAKAPKGEETHIKLDDRYGGNV